MMNESSRQGQGRSRQRKHNLNSNNNLMGFDSIEINLVFIMWQSPFNNSPPPPENKGRGGLRTHFAIYKLNILKNGGHVQASPTTPHYQNQLASFTAYCQLISSWLNSRWAWPSLYFCQRWPTLLWKFWHGLLFMSLVSVAFLAQRMLITANNN